VRPLGHVPYSVRRLHEVQLQRIRCVGAFRSEAMKLSEAEPNIRAALDRLAESSRELRCFVVVTEPLTGRFVRFCTPPPPSRFVGSPRIETTYPLIFQGTGKRKPIDYEPFNETCDVDFGVHLALDILSKYLPQDAEILIKEESTNKERPS